MKQPTVTIVCVPRERYSFARESLESLLANTRYPYRLVYVDNRSPRRLREWLEYRAREHDFELVRPPHYLSPNQARNFGYRHATGEYVAFVDNDVVFSPGWLTALVECATETGATVTGPVVCQHRPFHTEVHCAGGEFMPAQELAKFRAEPLPDRTDSSVRNPRWRVREKIYLQNEPVAGVDPQRRKVGFVEFHCLLVERAFLQRHGGLDEGFMSTKEYVDLAMTVARAGGSVWLEPRSLVTFRTHPPAPALALGDLPYFMLRWSDRWLLDSLAHMRRKWDLVEDEYFEHRYRKLGWRRRMEIVKPLGARFSLFGKDAMKWLTKRMKRSERRLNAWISARHARRVAALDNSRPRPAMHRTESGT